MVWSWPKSGKQTSQRHAGVCHHDEWEEKQVKFQALNCEY